MWDAAHAQWRTALDTHIVIALMRNDPRVLKQLESQPLDSAVLPAMVLQELSFGACQGRLDRLTDNLLKVRHLRFPVVSFNTQDAEAAGRIRAELARAGTPIGPYDALIAAQALTRQLTLITHHTREFARVPGLRVEDWLV